MSCSSKSRWIWDALRAITLSGQESFIFHAFFSQQGRIFKMILLTTPTPTSNVSLGTSLKCEFPTHIPELWPQNSGHVMDEASSWLQGKPKGNHWPNALSWERLWDSVCDQWEMISGLVRNRGRRLRKGEVAICSVEVDESYSISSADICYHVLFWLSGKNTFERVSFSYYLFSN